jgi:hypothetical protein
VTVELAEAEANRDGRAQYVSPTAALSRSQSRLY